MATDPVFYTIPKIDSVLVATVNTNLAAPTGADIIYTAPATAAGAKISRITVNQTADLAAAAVLNIFFHTGAAFDALFEPIVLNVFDLTTATQQDADAIFNKAYKDILLPNAWSLRAAVTLAGAASAFQVIVHALEAA